jgi:uncharacterized protein (TIGR02391 family)
VWLKTKFVTLIVDYPITLNVPHFLRLPNLKTLQASAQAQLLPVPGQPVTLTEQRNSHWRTVAEYDKWVQPLYLYLENIDWQRVANWYADFWHREFVRSFYHYKQEWSGYHRGGMYRNSKKPGGRLIQRDRLYPRTTYRVKLKLPIPTPLEHAQRRMNESFAQYQEILTKNDAKAKAEAADERKYLADRLKAAANRLGRIEKPYWHSKATWNPDWELEQATDPKAARRLQSLHAKDLGHVLATVEQFWLCWRDFHTAELEAITGTSTASVPILSIPPSLAHLHLTVQKVASTRFATAHYSDAILAACTALDKAIQVRTQRADLNGKQLMDVAFTPKSPVLRLSQQDNEQTGFMLLYQGLMLAIRNHYAHNNTSTDPARALEWLGFISALFYKLDEALPATVPTP